MQSPGAEGMPADITVGHGKRAASRHCRAVS